jgi:spore germination cell wall hydrolase CwlJ-like protein
MKRLADQIPSNVLWYHANYVAPSWGRRLNKVTQIGAHIFYS